MLFSIVVPVYNSDKYLRKCIKSILMQTYQAFEIIIINDGSTDSSNDILEDFEKRDDRIKVYNFKNEGVTVSRKKGVSLAKGDYILFVDSDDTINKNLLLNIKETINKFPNVEIVRFKARMINDKPGYDHELFNTDNSKYNIQFSGIEAIKEWSAPNKRYENFWLYAIKKDNLSIIYECPNLKTSGDYAFIPILIAKSKSVAMIDYIGYNYTCNNQNSLTRKEGYNENYSRARSFLLAYNYLMKNMHEIEKESGANLQFFYKDWKQRLIKRYKKLNDSLKNELKADFEQVLKNW